MSSRIATVSASNAFPSCLTDKAGAFDVDVEIRVDGELVAEGGVTLVPDAGGTLVSWGSRDHWCSASLLAWVDSVDAPHVLHSIEVAARGAALRQEWKVTASLPQSEPEDEACQACEACGRPCCPCCGACEACGPTCDCDEAPWRAGESARLDEEAISALANYGALHDMGDHYTLEVPASAELEDIQDCLPDGWAADWMGHGNTDQHGRSTEDVCIARSK